MTDKTPPYVIDFDDIREGDTIERTTPDGSKTILIAAHYQPRWWWSPDRDLAINDGGGTLTLLERPEPPVPALPTIPRTVISCTVDGEPGAVLTLDDEGDWVGPYASGEWGAVIPQRSHRITDWTVVYDPISPKIDDRLRERVENMAEDYRHSDIPYVPASEIFHRLRSILKERETK